MNTSHVLTVLSVLVQFVFVGAFAFGAYYLFVVQPRKLRAAFEAFAAKYGLTYSGRGVVTYKGLLPGNMRQVVYGVLRASDKPAALFYYTHVTGSGKSRKEYERTVAAIGIKSTGSHLFINSKINDIHEVPSLARSQRYEAEGNFSKYFDMYFPGGHQIPALSLFAPDVMAVIMADYGFYDIEIVDNIMYVYDYKYQRTFKEFDEFFDLALKLSEEIDSNAPRKLQFANEGTGADTDGAPGLQRLKPFAFNITNVSAAVGTMLFFVAPILLPSLGEYTALPTAAGILLVFVWIGITIARSEKRRKDYLIEREKYRK